MSESDTSYLQNLIGLPQKRIESLLSIVILRNGVNKSFVDECDYCDGQYNAAIRCIDDFFPSPCGTIQELAKQISNGDLVSTNQVEGSIEI